MLILVACFLTIKGGEKTVHNSYAEKFRFMDKRVREISRFFVAPPHVFPLSVCARTRESTHRFIHKYLQLSTYNIQLYCKVLKMRMWEIPPARGPILYS